MSSASKNVRFPPRYKYARSLPNDVWCKRCFQFRPLATFARNRQNDAMFWLSKGASMDDKKILDKMICSNCTAAAPVEIKCTGCNKTRSLDKFSATQRRDPDTARCRKCISEIENVKPGQQDPYEADDSDEDYMTSITGDLTSRSSTSRRIPSTLSNGFEPIPSITSKSRMPTNTTTSGSSISGLSNLTSATNVKPPRIQTGSGGFAVVKSGHRDVPVPDYDDDDDDVAMYSDDEDWHM
ncbi:hypothetical protein QM012_002097 [Aureobasidium pullulans]|uniref:Stc1 domain-containing protein n=1 Tax=Aureobasidium pullulans TaxID=5580 RepID=A0ABR0TDG2_AURPU